jgi:hypothetical protein
VRVLGDWTQLKYHTNGVFHIPSYFDGGSGVIRSLPFADAASNMEISNKKQV